MDVIQFTKTEKGRDKACCDGYFYNFEKKQQTGCGIRVLGLRGLLQKPEMQRQNSHKKWKGSKKLICA